MLNYGRSKLMVSPAQAVISVCLKLILNTIQTVLGNPDLASKISELPITNEDPSAPKAYLNILFFDDKLELIPSESKKIQVTASVAGNSWEVLNGNGNIGTTVVCPSCPSGVVLIYIDNQTIGKTVWFDDLFVGHYNSEILEENHYYPFGLTLSKETAGLTKNPYKLTTKELEKSFDLNLYDFGARMQDMQVGRWFGIDPLAEKYAPLSPYNYCGNNPVKYLDPNGKEIWISYNGKKQLKYDNGKLFNEDGSEYNGSVKGFLKNTFKALTEISQSETGNAMLEALSGSENKFTIKASYDNPKKRNEFEVDQEKIKHAYAETGKAESRFKGLTGGAGGTVYWNSSGITLPTTKGDRSNATTDLAHELAHGYDANRGMLNTSMINNLKVDEYQASYRENLIRGELKLPLRTSYATKDLEGYPLLVPVLDSENKPILPSGYKP